MIETGKLIYVTKPTGPHNLNEIPPIKFYNWCASVIQFFDDNFDSDFVFRQLFIEKVLNDTRISYPQQFFVSFGMNTLSDVKKLLKILTAIT